MTKQEALEAAMKVPEVQNAFKALSAMMAATDTSCFHAGIMAEDDNTKLAIYYNLEIHEVAGEDMEALASKHGVNLKEQIDNARNHKRN